MCVFIAPNVLCVLCWCVLILVLESLDILIKNKQRTLHTHPKGQYMHMCCEWHYTASGEYAWITSA